MFISQGWLLWEHCGHRAACGLLVHGPRSRKEIDCCLKITDNHYCYSPPCCRVQCMGSECTPGFLGVFRDLGTFPDGLHASKSARTLKVCILPTTTDLNLPACLPMWPFPLGNEISFINKSKAVNQLLRPLANTDISPVPVDLLGVLGPGIFSLGDISPVSPNRICYTVHGDYLHIDYFCSN